MKEEKSQDDKTVLTIELTRVDGLALSHSGLWVLVIWLIYGSFSQSVSLTQYVVLSARLSVCSSYLLERCQ